MFSKVAALALFTALTNGQYNANQVEAACKSYFDICNSAEQATCKSYYEEAEGMCNTEATNHLFGRCVYGYLDGSHNDDEAYKELALCLVENTKDITAFTCYNNVTTVVDCNADIENNMDFRLDLTGDTSLAGDEFFTTLTVNWGGMNIIPDPTSISWNDGEIDAISPYRLPHINLHACKLTDVQMSCSCKLLQRATANSTVSFTTTMKGDQREWPLGIIFDSPGTWRLLGHIQIWEDTSETTDNGYVFWDIAKAIDITVTARDPTNSPTVASDVSDPGAGGNVLGGGSSGSNPALAICLSLVGACACCMLFFYVREKQLYQYEAADPEDMDIDHGEYGKYSDAYAIGDAPQGQEAADGDDKVSQLINEPAGDTRGEAVELQSTGTLGANV